MTIPLPVFPVVELFGPVIEGEGAIAGRPTHYVRFGLCDYRCAWCDSLHAVIPAQVKANATYLDAPSIFSRVQDNDANYGYKVVTFSGGNPLVHDLETVAAIFVAHNWTIKVETQGSIWRNWLLLANIIMVSPKPPSSGMKFNPNKFGAFWRAAVNADNGHNRVTRMKIPVFDETDLDFALEIAKGYRHRDTNALLYLSCGTKADDTRDSLGARYAWLCEAALPKFAKMDAQISVLPQLHVVAHLHKLGV